MDEAIDEYHEAIHLKPDSSDPHNGLGDVLKDKGFLDKAIDEYGEVIRLQPDSAEAHCRLGVALQQKAQFSEALRALRRGHKLGSRKPNWTYPSAQWVAEAERLVELDAKLPAVLRGEVNPSGPAEQVEFAWLCVYYKHQNAAAARFYAEAFATEPELAADLDKQHRYNATCAAALAALGQGEDSGASEVDESERARLRRQSLDWLRTDLAVWKEQLESNKTESSANARSRLQHWQRDSDLAGVRDTEALAKLSDLEREAWGKLWEDVAELLRKPSGQ